MNEQTKSFKEKNDMVQEYIKKANPYKPLEPLKFDLRAYAAYLKENSLSGKDVPESVLQQFAR